MRFALTLLVVASKNVWSVANSLMRSLALPGFKACRISCSARGLPPGIDAFENVEHDFSWCARLNDVTEKLCLVEASLHRTREIVIRIVFKLIQVFQVRANEVSCRE